MVTLREPTPVLVKELEGEADLPRGFVTHFHRATELYEAGQFHRALEELEAALAIWPGSPEAIYNQGVALCGLGRYQEALADYDRALAMAPDNGTIRAARATVLKKLLKGLATGGKEAWLGEKPKGSNPPIVLTAGPPISDTIIEDRG